MSARRPQLEAALSALAAFFAAFLATRLSCLAWTAALAEASPAGDTVWPAAAGAPLPWAEAVETAATSNRDTRASFFMGNLSEGLGEPGGCSANRAPTHGRRCTTLPTGVVLPSDVGAATSPGPSCEEAWKAFKASEACFAPYHIVGGRIKPEAFDHCVEVAQPQNCPLSSR